MRDHADELAVSAQPGKRLERRFERVQATQEVVAWVRRHLRPGDFDVVLADESLRGAEREAARAAGNARKTATVEFFRSLEDLAPAAAGAALAARLPAGASLPARKRT